MTARSLSCALLVTGLAQGAALLVNAEARAAGLWGEEDLIAPPRLRANDIVTIVADPAAADAAAGADEARPRPVLLEIAARVVKVLPNGNLVLEARIALGEGWLLLGGEASPERVERGRRVRLSRLAKLAAVARDLRPGVLGSLLREALAE